MTLGLEFGIAQDLETAGFGTYDPSDAESDIRVGEEPNKPDNVIVVLNTAGGRIPSEVSEEWLITVRVRDTSYEDAHERLRDIAIYLQEKGQGDFGGVNVGRLAPSGTPAPLGRDDQRRYRVEQTFLALMKRSFTFV
jgi:hypothetical protein